MRIARYKDQSNEVAVGLVEGESIRKLAVEGMTQLIVGGSTLLSELADKARGAGKAISLDQVTLLAPLTSTPNNVFCVGLNYSEHRDEARALSKAPVEPAQFPTFFTKPNSTLADPYGPLVYWANLTQALDYEVELAVVIGKGGRDIRREDASDHIFGYMIANDVSARDVQFRHGQWFKGKSLDGSLPIGPWIVTADEVPEPDRMELSLTVNGEERQRASVSDMIFSVPELIEHLSAGLTLTVGDVILTGTPAGVGVAMTPPAYLREDDVVECRISGIGTIRNTVVVR